MNRLRMISQRSVLWLTALVTGLASIGLQAVAFPSAASAACVQPYKVASDATLKSTASTTIGQLGMETNIDPSKPWEGNDFGQSMTQMGSTVFLGGRFERYIWQGTTYQRHNIMAFNMNTGAPTSFAPAVDGDVESMALSCTGTALYVAGNFHHVNGVARNYVAKIDIASGSVYAFNPNPNGKVSSVSLSRGGRVIIAGYFTKLGSTSRVGISSVNTVSGAPTSWLAQPFSGHDPIGALHVHRFVTNHRGTLGVAIGNFNEVNGRSHRRIALFNLTDSKASVTPWATRYVAQNANHNGSDCSKSFGAPELDVSFTPGDHDFVTASTGGAHAYSICDSFAIWNADSYNNASAKPLAIQYTGGDMASAVSCTSYICIGTGHFRWGDNPPILPVITVDHCDPDVPPIDNSPGYAGYGCKGPTAQARPGIMQFTLSNGKLTSWNPTRSRQVASSNYQLWTPVGLFLATDGDTFAGQNINDLVLIPYN
jgi:hypothetical protein